MIPGTLKNELSRSGAQLVLIRRPTATQEAEIRWPGIKRTSDAAALGTVERQPGCAGAERSASRLAGAEPTIIGDPQLPTTLLAGSATDFRLHGAAQKPPSNSCAKDALQAIVIVPRCDIKLNR